MSNAIYQNTYELSFFPFCLLSFLLFFYCVVISDHRHRHYHRRQLHQQHPPIVDIAL